MYPELSSALRQAADYIYAGQPQNALPLLAAYLKNNPNSEQGWLLLSQALNDPIQQRDCLQRVLQINPNNADALERLGLASHSSVSPFSGTPPFDTDELPPETPSLSALRSAADRPISASSQQFEADGIATPATASLQDRLQDLRQRLSSIQPPWLLPVVVSGVALCILISCCVTTFLSVNQSAAPGATGVAAIATRRPTATRTPAPKPTQTLTPLPPTITPTRAPSPTQSFPTPNASIAAQMGIIQQQVANLRGLPIQGEIPRYLASPSWLRGEGKRILSESIDPVALKNVERAYSFIGLIGSYNLTAYTLNSQVDGLGGFYMSGTKDLFVVGAASDFKDYAFVYEYNRALTDQQLGVGDLGVYPQCQGDEQRCAAIRALVQGDAALLTQQWLQNTSPKNAKDIFSQIEYQLSHPSQFVVPESVTLPAFVEQNATFYNYSYKFVKYIYDRSKWDAVNLAYANPPQSTEQILHPAKYVSGEAPAGVASPPLTDTLGAGWQMLANNSLGEWMTYLLLGYGADEDAKLDDKTATAAAAGWGGDNYQVYYNAASNQPALAVQWQWDTPADAKEFQKAMREYLDKRFRGGKLAGRPAGDCWTANNQTTCFYLKGQATLWLLAPDTGMVDALLTQYPDFP